MSNKSLQKRIGYRVKAARESRKWSQLQLKEALGLNDRQSISDIENGKRALKPEELAILAETLDREIEFFIDPFCVVGEAQFCWRASKELPQLNFESFELKIGRLFGLLRWLRENEQEFNLNPLKYNLRLNKKSSYEEANSCAESLVQKLDLGLIPAEKLIEKVEQDLDVPILFIDTIKTPEGHSISGATCHLQDMSAILINRKESDARKFYDIAHELFHVLTWTEMKPAHFESNRFNVGGNSKRIEQLADNFAAALLMPKSSLDHFINSNHINDVEYLAGIATKLRVSSEALAYRLYNLNRIDEQTRDALKKYVRSTNSDCKQFSFSFVTMLHNAIEHGLLSIRKAAKAMDMNFEQLTKLFNEYSLSDLCEI